MAITARLLRTYRSTGGFVPPESGLATTFDQLQPSEQEDVFSALTRFIAEDDSHKASTWSPIWIVRKPKSIVLLVELSPHRERVIVKRQRGDRRDLAARALLKESHYHQLIRGVNSTAPTCAPPPLLATYPDLLVQITQYIDGHTILAMIVRAGIPFGKDRRKVVDAMASAGSWLRSFTGHPAPAARDLHPTEITSGLLDKWTNFQKHSPTLARRVPHDRLVRWLQAESGRLGGEDCLAVNCHGDFAPGNILVDKGGQLFLLDFADGKVGSRLHDACFFLHQLWHFQFNPLMSRSLLSEAKKAFTRSFGEDRLAPGPLYRLEKARQYVASLHSISVTRRKRSLLSRAHDRWFAAACVRELEKLSREP